MSGAHLHEKYDRIYVCVGTNSICLINLGVTTEYHATIVLDVTAHLFVKKGKCTRINYRQLWRIL